MKWLSNYTCGVFQISRTFTSIMKSESSGNYIPDILQELIAAVFLLPELDTNVYIYQFCDYKTNDFKVTFLNPEFNIFNFYLIMKIMKSKVPGEQLTSKNATQYFERAVEYVNME